MSTEYEVITYAYNETSGRHDPMINMERLLAIAGFDINDEGENEELDNAMMLLGECYAEAAETFKNFICYTAFGYDILDDGTIDFDFTKVKSETLKTQLEDCEYVVGFGATLGEEVNALIDKYADNPLKQRLMAALACERIATLCDAFGDDLSMAVRTEGRMLKPYIVPGTEDVPVEMAAKIAAILDSEVNIGVAVSEDGKFTPSMSAIGMFGVTEAGMVLPFDDCTPDLCATCGNTSCASRK